MTWCTPAFNIQESLKNIVKVTLDLIKKKNKKQQNQQKLDLKKVFSQIYHYFSLWRARLKIITACLKYAF